MTFSRHSKAIQDLGGTNFAKIQATGLNKILMKFDQDLNHLEMCLSRLKT